MIRAAVLTLSDRGASGERRDESGGVIGQMLGEIGADIVSYGILPDERALISARLVELSEIADLVITTGGTGLSPRDVTPEATLDVIERELPGMAEAMRAEGLKLTRRAMLSRAVCGVRAGCLIINLPGSPRAVRENLSVVLDVLVHAVEKIKGSNEECAR
jgi:molybdenum cofactor synthesis domain-containing protein